MANGRARIRRAIRETTAPTVTLFGETLERDDTLPGIPVGPPNYQGRQAVRHNRRNALRDLRPRTPAHVMRTLRDARMETHWTRQPLLSGRKNGA